MDVRCSTRPICSAMPMNLEGGGGGQARGRHVGAHDTKAVSKQATCPPRVPVREDGQLDRVAHLVRCCRRAAAAAARRCRPQLYPHVVGCGELRGAARLHDNGADGVNEDGRAWWWEMRARSVKLSVERWALGLRSACAQRAARLRTWHRVPRLQGGEQVCGGGLPPPLLKVGRGGGSRRRQRAWGTRVGAGGERAQRRFSGRSRRGEARHSAHLAGARPWARLAAPRCAR